MEPGELLAIGSTSVCRLAPRSANHRGQPTNRLSYHWRRKGCMVTFPRLLCLSLTFGHQKSLMTIDNYWRSLPILAVGKIRQTGACDHKGKGEGKTAGKGGGKTAGKSKPLAAGRESDKRRGEGHRAPI